MTADPLGENHGVASGLVGRDTELAAILTAIREMPDAGGGLFLVGGDAGVGKTALVEAAFSVGGTRVLRGGAHASVTAPFALLLGAVGDDPVALDPDQGGVDGRIKERFEEASGEGPTVVFLDDLHWADAASLEFLSNWVAPSHLPLLVIGAYRSNELARQHPLRALRTRLRRVPGGRERHLMLSPLSYDDSRVLVERTLGESVDDEVAATLYRRSQGLPFYLEELTTAGVSGGAGTPRKASVDVVPETVVDAVLHRIAPLSEEARRLAEVAATAAAPVSMVVAADLAEDETALVDLLDSGLLVETGGDGKTTSAAFRHVLLAEALYVSIPWPRRRRHHAALAASLESHGGSPALIADHWMRAGERERARPLLLAAAEHACDVHAYRDAKDLLNTALSIWPSGAEDATRLMVLDRLGDCAERCGEVADAARAWEEVAAASRISGDDEALAWVEQRLAGAYELSNDWDRALTARLEAAEVFSRLGLAAEAASERLAVAAHYMTCGDLTEGQKQVMEARSQIDRLPETSREAVGLQARALVFEGHMRAMLGDAEGGTEMTRRALDLALDSGLDDVAAEVHAEHAYTLEKAEDYKAALAAMDDVIAFCRDRGLDAQAHVCMACAVPSLWATGQWDQGLSVGDEVLSSADAPDVARMVAAGATGLILVGRGLTSKGGGRLARAAPFSRLHEIFGLEVVTSWGLAMVDEVTDNGERCAERLRELVARCDEREETHYSVWALRWAASFFGRRHLASDLGACTDLLARAASVSSSTEATAALAHALGETAMLEGDARRAADQFERALLLLKPVNLPLVIAEIQVRAGVALAAAGERDKARDRLVAAYHTGRRLGARPCAAAARVELEAIGEDIGRRTTGYSGRADGTPELTSRERQVLQLVALGMTNREIATELYLSVRTVDMHVRNVLAKLGSRTRTEAVRRATDLDLLEAPQT